MFKPIEQKSVVEAIQQQITSLILEGQHLKPGSKLPSEKDMIRQFGVSRPALREAIRTMVGEGLLEIQPGLGTYVREPTSGAAIQANVVSLLLMPEDLMEIQEVRAILEPEVAARVAERATEKDLDELEGIMNEMEKAIREGHSIFELAWDFHRQLSRLAGNSAMAKIVDVIYEMIKTYEQPLYDRYFDPRQEIHDHLELVQVFRRRDPERARAAMKTHLNATSKKLSDAFLAGGQTTEVMPPEPTAQ
jgi:GntR family transcriptional repressor for pyruvate dehydrogenase complex